MKTFRTLALHVLCVGFLFSITSCAVLIVPDNGRQATYKHDNGNHYGWFKNPKNPHNPYNMKHGNDKGNHKNNKSGNQQ